MPANWHRKWQTSGWNRKQICCRITSVEEISTDRLICKRKSFPMKNTVPKGGHCLWNRVLSCTIIEKEQHISLPFPTSDQYLLSSVKTTPSTGRANHRISTYLGKKVGPRSTVSQISRSMAKNSSHSVFFLI